MGVRAVRLCFTSGAMRNHVPGRAGYGSSPTVSSPSPARMWMIAGRADVCSESCSPAAKAKSRNSTSFSLESVWLRMPRAGMGASQLRMRSASRIETFRSACYGGIFVRRGGPPVAHRREHTPKDRDASLASGRARARGLAVGGCDPTMPAIRATSSRCRWGDHGSACAGSFLLMKPTAIRTRIGTTRARTEGRVGPTERLRDPTRWHA
jgi:hypothetical protein